MKGSIHIKAIALTALVAALAIPAVAGAKATPQGYHFTTDTLGGNGNAPATQGVRIITDTLGGNGGTADAFERAVARAEGLHAAQPQGFRFITDTLGGNGGPNAAVSTSGGGFRWGDAGIGAGVMLGALALLAASLTLLRHRPLRAA